MSPDSADSVLMAPYVKMADAMRATGQSYARIYGWAQRRIIRRIVAPHGAHTRVWYHLGDIQRAAACYDRSKVEPSHIDR